MARFSTRQDPVPELFTPEELRDFDKELEKLLAKYPPDRKQAALIPALHAVQRRVGWLPDEGMKLVGERLGVAPMKVREVATFYTMFFLDPAGKHQLEVCTSISCYILGGEKLYDRLKHALDAGENGLSPDGKCRVRQAECLASCGTAPALRFDDEYHEKLTEDAIDALAKRARGDS